MRNPSDLPPQGPGGPQFRLPKFGRPSRGRILVSVLVGVVLLLVFSARGLSSFYVNVLWFNGVGFSDVYWGILRSKVELAAIFSLGCFAFLWLNLLIADKVAPLTLPNTPEDQTVMRIREATAARPRRRTQSVGHLIVASHRLKRRDVVCCIEGRPTSSQRTIDPHRQPRQQ